MSVRLSILRPLYIMQNRSKCRARHLLSRFFCILKRILHVFSRIFPLIPSSLFFEATLFFPLLYSLQPLLFLYFFIPFQFSIFSYLMFYSLCWFQDLRLLTIPVFLIIFPFIIFPHFLYFLMLVFFFFVSS